MVAVEEEFELSLFFNRRFIRSSNNLATLLSIETIAAQGIPLRRFVLVLAITNVSHD